MVSLTYRPEVAVLDYNANRNLELSQSDIDYEFIPLDLMTLALAKANERVIDLLVRGGARVSAVALYFAVNNKDEKTIKLLLKNTSQEKLGCYRSPLFAIAANHNQRPDAGDICEILIKHGFDINAERGNRQTPLVYAVKFKNTNVIETLLQYGAQPCREYDGKNGPCVPLKHSFILPTPTVESMVKYASLYVDDKDENKFFSYFKKNKARAFGKYAESCLAEIKTLKSLTLTSRKLNLYDFVVSQGEQLQMFLNDEDFSSLVLKLLTPTFLPIYQIVILKKLERKDIVNGVIEHLNINASFEEKRVFLNSYCSEKLCSFLSKKDLVYLWVAFNTKT